MLVHCWLKVLDLLSLGQVAVGLPVEGERSVLGLVPLPVEEPAVELVLDGDKAQVMSDKDQVGFAMGLTQKYS